MRRPGHHSSKPARTVRRLSFAGFPAYVAKPRRNDGGYFLYSCGTGEFVGAFSTIETARSYIAERHAVPGGVRFTDELCTADNAGSVVL